MASRTCRPEQIGAFRLYPYLDQVKGEGSLYLMMLELMHLALALPLPFTLNLPVSVHSEHGQTLPLPFWTDGKGDTLYPEIFTPCI